MKKLTLHAEDLAVESFPTAEQPWPSEGTVEGRALNPSTPPWCTVDAYPCKTRLTDCPCTPRAGEA
jgi:hypothetical protein